MPGNYEHKWQCRLGPCVSNLHYHIIKSTSPSEGITEPKRLVCETFGREYISSRKRFLGKARSSALMVVPSVNSLAPVRT